MNHHDYESKCIVLPYVTDPIWNKSTNEPSVQGPSFIPDTIMTMIIHIYLSPMSINIYFKVKMKHKKQNNNRELY